MGEGEHHFRFDVASMFPLVATNKGIVAHHLLKKLLSPLDNVPVTEPLCQSAAHQQRFNRLSVHLGHSDECNEEERQVVLPPAETRVLWFHRMSLLLDPFGLSDCTEMQVTRSPAGKSKVFDEEHLKEAVKHLLFFSD